MKSVKITAYAIVNVNGRGEKFKGDVIHNISDDLAAHLVNDCQVAEYLETPIEEKTAKSSKTRKTPKQAFDDAEQTAEQPAPEQAAPVDDAIDTDASL